MGIWTFEGIHSAIAPWTAPGLTVRGLQSPGSNNQAAIINEFNAVQPVSGDASSLESNWKDPTSGVTTWQRLDAPFPGPSLLGAPVAVSRLNNPGRMYVFAVGQAAWSRRNPGPSSLIYWNWNNLDVSPPAVDGWAPAVSLPGSAAVASPSLPAVAAWAAGRLDVFAVSTQNTLLHWWHNDPDPNFFGPETLPGSGVAGTPAAVSWASGRLDVFAGTTGGSLLHWWYELDNNWTFENQNEPETLGQASSPCAVSWEPGRLDVFAISPENTIVHWWYDGTVTPIQSFNHGPGQPLGGSNNCRAPSAVSWGPGRFDVFASNQQGQLLHWWQDTGGAGLTTPDMLLASLQGGDQVTQRAACASAGVGNLEVVALATQPNSPSSALDHWTWNSFG